MTFIDWWLNKMTNATPNKNVVRRNDPEIKRLKNLLREVVNGSGQEMSGCYAFCFKEAWLQKAKQAIGDE